MFWPDIDLSHDWTRANSSVASSSSSCSSLVSFPRRAATAMIRRTQSRSRTTDRAFRPVPSFKQKQQVFDRHIVDGKNMAQLKLCFVNLSIGALVHIWATFLKLSAVRTCILFVSSLSLCFLLFGALKKQNFLPKTRTEKRLPHTDWISRHGYFGCTWLKTLEQYAWKCQAKLDRVFFFSFRALNCTNWRILWYLETLIDRYIGSKIVIGSVGKALLW